LAKSIAWDGEGATCLIEVKVTGAASDADARIVAKSVVGSSLAKSAIFGHDPNWGRIAAAAGYSGAYWLLREIHIVLIGPSKGVAGRSHMGSSSSKTRFILSRSKSVFRNISNISRRVYGLTLEQVMQAGVLSYMVEGLAKGKGAWWGLRRVM
jgi:N-acetylglutamate synthase/N-acetylornithine aminotransferase